MILYEIKQELRDLVIIDINIIDDIEFVSFDEYLFRFPQQKKLVYAYLKECTEPIELSKLHKKFKWFGNLEWLLQNPVHQYEQEFDKKYAKVVNKYVRNPYTWVSSMINVQPYLFDAKYLLIGQYQDIAEKCAWAYFNTQSMQYPGIYNEVRTLDGLQQHNDWFIERLSIEKEFFDNILSFMTFSSSLRVKSYYKYIEVYDDASTLTMQFELTATEIITRVIFPKGSKNRGRKGSTSLVMKLFSNYRELFQLWGRLSAAYDTITTYLGRLDALNIERSNTYNRLFITTKQVLTDFMMKDSGTYMDDEHYLNLYSVTNGSVERWTISFSKKCKNVRLHRKIKFLNDKLNRTDEIQFSSYNLGHDIDKISHFLLMSGFINIGHVKARHNFYDYELLATGKSDTFALQFLKLPQLLASNVFAKYVACQDILSSEVEHLISSGLDAKDTRYKRKHKATNITTYFEWYYRQQDQEKFDSERSVRYQEKQRLIKNFTQTYKHIIKNTKK